MFDAKILGLVKEQPKHSFVFIAGPTCAGKTSLAEWLNQRMKNCAVIPMDNYYLSLDDPNLPPRDGRYPVFDNPGAYHLDELAQDLKSLQRGEKIAMPTYDIDENQRLPGTIEISGDCDYYLVEGLFAFYLCFTDCRMSVPNQLILDYGITGLKLFVTAEGSTRYSRRFKRDRKRFAPEMISDEQIHRHILRVEKAAQDLVIKTQEAYADLIIRTDN